MFIDARHHKISKRRRRGMGIIRNVNQHAPRHISPPTGAAQRIKPKSAGFFNPLEKSFLIFVPSENFILRRDMNYERG
jgi:hypothetical protein